MSAAQFQVDNPVSLRKIKQLITRVEQTGCGASELEGLIIEALTNAYMRGANMGASDKVDALIWKGMDDSTKKIAAQKIVQQ